MNASSPLVSIIIPVYNGANYMREAIDSALAQTYPHCEVLVINDGSTDNGETDRIARSYGERIRYFTKENGGVATALNLGIREMRGEYFSWLSHDDVYLPDKIAKQIAFMEKFDLYDAVLYSDSSWMDGKGNHISDSLLPGVSPDYFFQHTYLHSDLHGCTLLIPKQAFKEVGMFPEHLKTTQDYDLWFRMCRKFPFVHQAQILVKGRLHGAQGSRVIPEHQCEVDSLYQAYLNSWLEVALENKGEEEAFLQKKLFVEQLCQRGLEKHAESIFQTLNSPAQQAEFRIVCEKLRRECRNKQMKARVKSLFRPLWLMLPLQMRQRIRSIKKNMVNPAGSGQSSCVQRLDFTNYYYENGFGAVESRSGGGSSLFITRAVRRELPTLLHKLQVKTMLDIPCGDFNWMRHVDLQGIQYTGGDIVAELAQRNQQMYGNAERTFQYCNAITGPLPKVDLIFCRDCLVHLPFADALAALGTFKASGATWLLTTTFVGCKENIELAGIVWRPLNLCLPPFNLPEPAMVIDEKCVECGGKFADKSLALWDLRTC